MADSDPVPRQTYRVAVERIVLTRETAEIEITAQNLGQALRFAKSEHLRGGMTAWAPVAERADLLSYKWIVTAPSGRKLYGSGIK